jgi:ubiquinone/menaquinone biosynthesis C-methylase UbiE
MGGFKFDPAKTARLDDPARLDDLRPDVMWHALGDPDPSVIVDVGAGTGLMAEQFARLAPRATVYAADTEQTMLEWIARVRESLVGSGRIVPVLASETSVPLEDAVAGVVAMVNLHHELDDPVATYADAARLLAPGGRLLVVDWAKRETPHGPPVAVRAEPADIEAFLVQAGLESVREHEGLPYHTLITAMKPSR